MPELVSRPPRRRGFAAEPGLARVFVGAAAAGWSGDASAASRGTPVRGGKGGEAHAVLSQRRSCGEFRRTTTSRSLARSGPARRGTTTTFSTTVVVPTVASGAVWRHHARFGAGWNPAGAPIEALSGMFAVATAMAADEGRDPNALGVVVAPTSVHWAGARRRPPFVRRGDRRGAVHAGGGVRRGVPRARRAVRRGDPPFAGPRRRLRQPPALAATWPRVRADRRRVRAWQSRSSSVSTRGAPGAGRRRSGSASSNASARSTCAGARSASSCRTSTSRSRSSTATAPSPGLRCARSSPCASTRATRQPSRFYEAVGERYFDGEEGVGEDTVPRCAARRRARRGLARQGARRRLDVGDRGRRAPGAARRHPLVRRADDPPRRRQRAGDLRAGDLQPAGQRRRGQRAVAPRLAGSSATRTSASSSATARSSPTWR